MSIVHDDENDLDDGDDNDLDDDDNDLDDGDDNDLDNTPIKSGKAATYLVGSSLVINKNVNDDHRHDHFDDAHDEDDYDNNDDDDIIDGDDNDLDVAPIK